MRIRLWVVGLFLLWAGWLTAHEVITTNLTYTRDVSRILARRCITCHSESSAIPLTNYREVRPWAVAIKNQVLSRAMPPWGAVKGFGELASDDVLTQEEISLIAAWAVGGAPQGDPSLLPQRKPEQPSPPRDSLSHDVVVSTRTRLKKPLQLAGIRPQPGKPIASARIVARLPNGHVEPLLWLYRYDPRWRRVFRFRTPLPLPRGTVIEATTRLHYSLEILTPAAPPEQ